MALQESAQILKGMTLPNRKKSALVLAIILLAGAFFWLDLHLWLTLENIRGFQEQARDFYGQRPLTAIAAFAGVYLLVVALNLPGGALLGLLAGAVFGVLVGTVVVSFASTIAATVACALSRYLFRDLVRARFPQVLARVDQGMAREGAFYLFSLRLIPAVPFFVINMVMGLTAIPLRTYYWVSQAGMLPGTLVFVNAGGELGRLTSTGDVFSLRLLLAFALLGILPLVTNRLLGWYRRRVSGPCDCTQLGEESESAQGEITTTEHSTVGPAVIMVDAANAGAAHAVPGPPTPPLDEQIMAMASGCTRCGACATRCAFLQEYGLPGEIAAACSVGQSKVDPFACSLCNLCAALCPEKLEPGDLFLELRRQAAASPDFDLCPYRSLLSYERLGASPLFAAQELPTGCQSVFFPGCTLPGTRPQSTHQLFARLRELRPNLGLVLNCCHKPSHDLGRQGYFNQHFSALRQELLKRGVREIVVACPNCYKVFLRYGGKLQVKSAWELLADHQPPKSRPSVDDGVDHWIHGESGPMTSHGATIEPQAISATRVTIHDPCPLRHLSELQYAVRRLAASRGLEVKEMKSSGRRTLCCGEGGAVGRLYPELAAKWGEMRLQQADELPVLTYCAGCAGFLKKAGMSTIHLADLLADPASALKGKAPVSTGLKTYLNRLLFKYHLIGR